MTMEALKILFGAVCTEGSVATLHALLIILKGYDPFIDAHTVAGIMIFTVGTNSTKIRFEKRVPITG